MSGNTTEVKDKHFFNGEWLRKARPSEVEMEKEHQEGHLLIWYQLDLCSVEPLSEAHVKATTEHLYRKVPTLSACLGTRDGETWFKRVTNPNIDFKVLPRATVEEVRESLRNHHYESYTGPLFCVRLLQRSLDTAADLSDRDPSFSHKCHIIFGFHHGMTDGSSNMNLMGIFVSLLNDVVSGKPVKDDELIGSFASGEETHSQIMKRKILLENDLELKKKIADDMKFMTEEIPFIIKGFPTSKEEKYTSSLVKILDQNTTARFIQRCRQEKVTVNSAFTAIVNMAIVDILVEHGVINDSYVIQNFHTVNLRRYWDSKPSKALGLHMGYPLMMFSKTPRDVRDQFWEYSKDIGQSLKKDVLSGRLLFDKAYAMLTSENEPLSHDASDGNSLYKGDFITSNMGDVTSLVTEGGDHVRVRNIVRGSTFHHTEYSVLVNCHTFRGIFTMIFEYNAGVLQAGVAEKICSQIIKCILDISE